MRAKVGKEVVEFDDAGVEMALIGFAKTKKEIDALNEQLKSFKEVLSEKGEEILEQFDDASTITLERGNHAVKISFGIDVKINDEEKLKSILGDRFYDLVSETITQKPEKKLKEMALQDDAIRECLVIKDKAPSVSLVKAK